MAPVDLLMLSFAALTSPRADRGYVCLEALLLRRVRFRRQLDECVEWDLHPWALLLRHVHEVRVDASQDRLVRHDQDVLAALELHDDGLQADDHVAVRLAAEVAVVVLVFVALRKVIGVLLLDLGVRQAVADAGVELVQCFPFQLLEFEEPRGLDCSLEGGSPNGEFATVADRLGYEPGKRVCICVASF